MRECLKAARRYLSLAEAEERAARGLAELTDTTRLLDPGVTPVNSNPPRPRAWARRILDLVGVQQRFSFWHGPFIQRPPAWSPERVLPGG